jgi:hypothetical protein
MIMMIVMAIPKSLDVHTPHGISILLIPSSFFDSISSWHLPDIDITALSPNNNDDGSSDIDKDNDYTIRSGIN